jgi:hypothetical protein
MRAVRDQMVAMGWLAEGDGPSLCRHVRAAIDAQDSNLVNGYAASGGAVRGPP